jgi:hypothetical protein
MRATVQISPPKASPDPTERHEHVARFGRPPAVRDRAARPAL